jgi:hypothetical protein
MYPGVMGRDGARDLGYVQDAALALFGEDLGEAIPELERALGCRCEERSIALVGCIVALDEVTHVDVFLPRSGGEFTPCREEVLGPHAVFEQGLHIYWALGPTMRPGQQV